MAPRRGRKPKQPGSRRLGIMGAITVAVILLIVIVTFVGRNIWHADKLEQEQRTGTREVNGLS
ncbi:hypothetical protein [Novosphingobium sp. HR1a]|uniref:hypothetical protein n=1 Tax=Novosphingobium sp. HR1a TaxID=1395637 RepID=UPI001B3C8D06|nr:hypothetical protein [Novosphingobium sp. HR1a]